MFFTYKTKIMNTEFEDYRKKPTPFDTIEQIGEPLIFNQFTELEINSYYKKHIDKGLTILTKELAHWEYQKHVREISYYYKSLLIYDLDMVHENPVLARIYDTLKLNIEYINTVRSMEREIYRNTFHLKNDIENFGRVVKNWENNK